MRFKSLGCLGLLSVIVVGCASATAKTRNKVPYPAESKQVFINNCMRNAPRNFCECAFKKVQDQFTFADFKQADAQTQQTGQAPAAFVTAVQSCKR